MPSSRFYVSRASTWNVAPGTSHYRPLGPDLAAPEGKPGHDAGPAVQLQHELPGDPGRLPHAEDPDPERSVVRGQLLPGEIFFQRPAVERAGPDDRERQLARPRPADPPVSDLPAGTIALSVVAEPSAAVPIQLVLVDPSGSVLQTADASSGFAVIEMPVTQAGVYLVKLVNVVWGLSMYGLPRLL